jgi:hypothetical protein
VTTPTAFHALVLCVTYVSDLFLIELELEALLRAPYQQSVSYTGLMHLKFLCIVLLLVQFVVLH